MIPLEQLTEPPAWKLSPWPVGDTILQTWWEGKKDSAVVLPMVALAITSECLKCVLCSSLGCACQTWLLSLQPIVQEESFSLDPVALQCLNLCGDEKGRVSSKGRVLFVLDLTGQARAKGNHKEKPNPRSSKNRASQACIDGFLREESFYSLLKTSPKSIILLVSIQVSRKVREVGEACEVRTCSQVQIGQEELKRRSKPSGASATQGPLHILSF